MNNFELYYSLFEDILTDALRKYNCTLRRLMSPINKIVVCLTLLLGLSHLSMGQDPTIYVSPFDVEETLSKIHVSLDANHHKYIHTSMFEADSLGAGEFKGRVHVVDFMMKDVEALIACEPTVAFDLPLKILVWSEESDVYLAYVNPFIIKRRYFINGCDEYLSAYNKAMIRIVNDAIRTQ